ncbi:TIGR03086 family protein [Streptomyces sp. RKND-216]|nr:TIGR03086 family protein [Streptomyces sp. RKND-216]
MCGSLSPPCRPRSDSLREWDVCTLLEHVVDGTQRTAALGEAGPGAVMEEETPRGVPDDGWAAAYARARARFRAAWADDGGLAGTYTVPWGDVPGHGVVGAEVQETVVHAWDLARALGAVGRLDARLAEATLPFAEQIVPAEPRGGAVPFGPVRPTAPDAGPYTRLAAWLGRDVG